MKKIYQHLYNTTGKEIITIGRSNKWKRKVLFTLLFLTYELSVLDKVLAMQLSQRPESFQNADVTSLQQPHLDLLDALSWWRTKAQATANQGKQYNGCLFGDSISSGIGNTLGEHTFNFGKGGLSSVSLVEQLKLLSSANVKCYNAIIAVGTNDAWHKISDKLFIKNMRQAISWVRAMGATHVTLIPAFYSTIAASHDPTKAGSIQRVESINALIHQVAATEDVPIESQGLKFLFKNQSLKENLTFDGVHLNENGKKIYRQFLLKILEARTRPLANRKKAISH